MKTKVLEVEYGDSMDIHTDKVMLYEVPSDYSCLAEHLIEDAANELNGDEQKIEALLKNTKYLYSIYDVVTDGEEDYFKALTVNRRGNCQFTYYLNIESMSEKGLKMITQINGIISYDDNLLQLEKDMADIQNGMIKEEEYGFYYDSVELLHQYISIRNGSEKGIRKLSFFTPGEIFEDCDGMEYIVCEHFGDGTVGVITRDTIEVMKFGKNNNWIGSEHRNYLNNEFLAELERKFGENSIVTHEVDLLSLDGRDEYGSSLDKVSDLTLDRFRKYRKYEDSSHKPYALSTPNSTNSGCDNLQIEFIDENNVVGSTNCCERIGIRPFFVVKSSGLVMPV